VEDRAPQGEPQRWAGLGWSGLPVGVEVGGRRANDPMH